MCAGGRPECRLLATSGSQDDAEECLLIPQQPTLGWPHWWLARYCTVTPAGRSLDRNSSTDFRIRFHTENPSRSPFSSRASARMAAWIGTSLPCYFTRSWAVRSALDQPVR